jgi:formyltetrahydrofolate-dependent phosphoribosylglycinamide formyltransferase
MKIAVFLSGTGRTLENLILQIANGVLQVEIAAVVSDRQGVRGNEIALSQHLPLFFFPEKKEDSFCILHDLGIELVCLAGFLSKLIVPPDWQNKVMNIHPSLLPAFGGKGFYGLKVHSAVLERGCKFTGCTVHFVDNEYDHGPIILQRVVEVHSDDTPETLAGRVFTAECAAYPEAINLFQNGRLRVEGQRVLAD